MFNYETILLNELNYIKSCIMPDGAVLHRPPKQGVVDVIPVIPGESMSAGMAIVANYASETDTCQQILNWYINNIANISNGVLTYGNSAPVNSGTMAPAYLEYTIPCYLYTVYPDRSFTREVIDYTYLEILKDKDDPTSPNYEKANDPVYQGLFEMYLGQSLHASMFLNFAEMYIQWSGDFTWGYAHMEDLSNIASVLLSSLLQYQSGENSIDLSTTMARNLMGESSAHLLDTVSAYTGLIGTYELLTTVQNPSATIFQNSANALINSLPMYMVNNQYTQPVGTIFATSLDNIESQKSYTTTAPSIKDIQTNWDDMSKQLQINFFIGAASVLDAIDSIPNVYSAKNLYNVLNISYPNWTKAPPTSYDGSEPWMIAGSVALQLGNIGDCVEQIVSSQEFRDIWNISESALAIRNLLQLIDLFNTQQNIESTTVWNSTLKQNIPSSLESLYVINDISEITPVDENNNLFMFLGDPLNLNNEQSTLVDFLDLAKGSNVIVIKDYGKVTDQILTLPDLVTSQIYAYIPVGIGERSQGLPVDSITKLVDDYYKRGFYGVYYDEFGFTNGLTRDQQNYLLDYAHAYGLSVFVNADHASEVCDPSYDSIYNPNSEPSHMGVNDIFLIESFATDHGDIDHDSDDVDRLSTLTYTISRVQEAQRYSTSLGFKLAALAYASLEDTPDHWQYNSDNVFEIPMYSGTQVGLNTNLVSYVGNYDSTNTLINRMVEMGGEWAREHCLWSNVEVGLLGNFDYTIYDGIVNNLINAGQNILLVLAYDNELAPIVNNWEDFLGAYVNYVTSTVSHFKGRVSNWEIWDMENLQQNWQITPSAEQYFEMLSSSYTAIKNIDPHATVILGGVGGTGIINEDGSSSSYPCIDVEFIKELYELGAANYFDVLGLTPFIPVQLSIDTDDNGPDADDFGQASTPMPFILNPTSNPVWTQPYAQLLSLMNSFGDKNKPIWITETGLSTIYNNQRFIPDDFQYFYVKGFLEFMKNNPKIERIFFEELIDASDNVSYEDDNYGFLYYDMSPKEVFMLTKNLIRGAVYPYNLDAIIPIWQAEIQYAYILYLMLGLNYFQYAPFYNLSFNITEKPNENGSNSPFRIVDMIPDIPLVINPSEERAIYLSTLENNGDGTYKRSIHSGILNAGVINDTYTSSFDPFKKPMILHTTCPQCTTILYNLEHSKPIDAYVENGWKMIETAEQLGWNLNINSDSSFVATSNQKTSTSVSSVSSNISLTSENLTQIIAYLQQQNISLTQVMNILSANNISMTNISNISVQQVVNILAQNGVNIDLQSVLNIINGTTASTSSASTSTSSTTSTTTGSIQYSGPSIINANSHDVVAVEHFILTQLYSMSAAELEAARYCTECGMRIL